MTSVAVSTGTARTRAVRADAPAPAGYFRGWDHIELWVGNARAFAGWLASGFGFEFSAYAGPETGRRDSVSYLMTQGDVRFVVTGALGPDSPVAEHVRRHGDGVARLAIRVTDAVGAFRAAAARGATVVRAPWAEVDQGGVLMRAEVATYGETVHTFVDREAFGGELFLPGFTTDGLPPRPTGPPTGLLGVDHCVGNVGRGALGDWVAFYRDVMGFDQLVHFGDDQISTEYTALMSTVVWDGAKVVLPLNEPADGRRKSQIDEFLEFYGGPGVQHIALRTDDIVTTVAAMRERGVRFLEVPATYYDEVRRRMDGYDLPWDDLVRLGVLVDRDDDGYLLQLFTENVTDRPTLFLEVIQRVGATGFGAGNFKALFEAIERAQARRGNL
ncbi:MAG TPA: 4-hydroxyphenylpyruvate dioxygenase [Acidimicrobiales bacterium]|nr:4-hydroxyphenylpyruvate dioxygenase [Acidimicrobiales bacterium]